MFLPIRRATLLIPSGPDHDPERKHLFIILTDPCQDDEKGERSVLLASLTSVPNRVAYDSTCILQAGDHPFLRHASYVFYQKARIESVATLENGVQKGVFIQHDPIEASIFNRVCNGLELSRRVTPRNLEFYRKATR